MSRHLPPDPFWQPADTSSVYVLNPQKSRFVTRSAVPGGLTHAYASVFLVSIATFWVLFVSAFATSKMLLLAPTIVSLVVAVIAMVQHVRSNSVSCSDPDLAVAVAPSGTADAWQPASAKRFASLLELRKQIRSLATGRHGELISDDMLAEVDRVMFAAAQCAHREAAALQRIAALSGSGESVVAMTASTSAVAAEEHAALAAHCDAIAALAGAASDAIAAFEVLGPTEFPPVAATSVSLEESTLRLAALSAAARDVAITERPSPVAELEARPIGQ